MPVTIEPLEPRQLLSAVAVNIGSTSQTIRAMGGNVAKNARNPFSPITDTNSNYALGYNNTYIYTTDNTPRPSGWGTPTSIVNARFVRLNFTLNF